MREALASRARSFELAAGEWLFREGDIGDAMYIVRTGRLDVVAQTDGAVIRELGRGDALGELALLAEAPRSASVRAARASALLAIDRADFAELLDASPELSRSLNHVLARQLRDSHTPVHATRPRAVTVAVVGLDPRAPVEMIAEGVRAAVARDRTTALLQRPDVGAVLPRTPAGEPDRAGIDPAGLHAPMLDRAEVENELVLLAGGSALESDDWTEFCLRQADRILAVTCGGEVPDALSARPDLHGCELVIHDVAPGSGQLQGWATLLEPIETHVTRTDLLDADLARLARRLTGRSVGLVLSGGGARGFAHIGVIAELAAAGITVDRVMGVSMGAVIGALYAGGLDAEEIDEICFEEWVQRRPLADYTIPRHALIRGERFRSMLHRMFANTLIEELPRSFACAYTELRSGRLIIARHGPLWERVGFSICLPVIGPPQVRGREIYVDGSLTDNLPVRTMAELAEGPIIAVDVRANLGGGGASRADGRERVPSLGETLARVLLLGSANTTESARQYADLVIRPRPEGVGLLEFHQLDAAREAGRTAAAEALEHAPPILFGEVS
jgi:predicted acylesterase/phospholipase RssA/CRP-like cAMP-binding protein